jgi:uncharacterized membrane protein
MKIMHRNHAPRLSVAVVALILTNLPSPAHAAMSFCNRTSTPIEAALGYRDDQGNDAGQVWTSEGWWRIEPGQCARVYGEALSQRFYFYYGRALSAVVKDEAPTVWSGKYMFCTDDKAFRVTGDGDCASRNYQSTGFQELDLGSNGKDYTLDFKDGTSR